MPSIPPSVPPPTLPGFEPPAAPPRRWLVYVDLDAYYVSCELRTRPELAGLPVIVGPPPDAGPSRGVVLSASYEARKHGVRSALPAGVAQRLCPDAVWIAPDFSKYVQTSDEVRRILGRFSEEVIPFSIDEAAVLLDVTDAAEAHLVAERIQSALRAELGLPASLGVATTRVVAKIATDQAKPGGIRVVGPDEIAEFLGPLPVRAIPGVGPKTDEILRRHGVQNISDLARRRPVEVTEWMGPFGRELVSLARGHPVEPTDYAAGPRSRSTDHTFAADVTRWEELEPVVRRMAGELWASLDREGLRYATVGIAFRWADFARSQRSRSLAAAREGPVPLEENAVRLARELWESEAAGRQRPVRTVSVRTERLAERTQHQASLDEYGKFPASASGAK
jgi:nucleotidyltransferase/DNA polymerase involved in DNA repair